MVFLFLKAIPNPQRESSRPFAPLSRSDPIPVPQMSLRNKRISETEETYQLFVSIDFFGSGNQVVLVDPVLVEALSLAHQARVKLFVFYGKKNEPVKTSEGEMNVLS